MGKKLTTEEFIEKAKSIHGNKYNYDVVEYINKRTKIKILCKKHSLFLQTPDSHIYGESGCPNCGLNTISLKKKLTNEEFIEKAKMVHGDKYEYCDVKYVDNTTEIKIKCIKHGFFKQTPKNHLKGNGCSICCESKGELEIRKFIKALKIPFDAQKKL